MFTRYLSECSMDTAIWTLGCSDADIVADSDGQLRYWRRRCVEGSWLPLNFPEAWITGVLAIACVCNVVLNSRGQRKLNEQAC